MGAEQSSSNGPKRTQPPRCKEGEGDRLNLGEVKNLLDQQRRIYERRCEEILQNRTSSQHGAAESSSPSPAVPMQPNVSEPPKAPPQTTLHGPNTTGPRLHQFNNLSLNTPSSFERSRTPYNYGQEDLQNVRDRPFVRNNNLYPNLNNNMPSTSTGARCTQFTRVNTMEPTLSDFVVIDQHGSQRARPSAPPRERSIPRSRDTNNEEDNFKCPTCKDFFGLYIYNCPNGHSACKSCKLRNTPCRICGNRLLERRNIALEALIAERKVPCSNRDEGCSLIIKLAEMEFHLRECPFNEMACPLNTVFPGICPSWRGKLTQMSAHFNSMHPKQQVEDGDEMQLTNICSENKIVYLIAKGNFKFLFHLWVSEIDRMIYMATQLIGTKFSAHKWTYNIEIYNKREPRRKYEYTDFCSAAIEPVINVFKESKCAVLPLSYAMNFVNEGGISYKFRINKTFKGRSNFQRGFGRGGRRP